MNDEVRDESSDAEQVIADAEEILSEAELAEPVEDDLDELGQVLAERDEFRQMAQRLQADFENFRKRSAAQAEQSAERRVAGVVEQLLPVLDTFDLAASHLSTEGEPSAEAAALSSARAMLVDTLSKLGLEAVPGTGEAFDPEVHEAVMHVEAEDGEGPVVDEVLRAGYVFRGTTIRAAMVRVRG